MGKNAHSCHLCWKSYHRRFWKNSSYDVSPKLLEDMGIKACIVSRGYRGKIQRPHYVTKNDTFDKVGDEPLMLSKKGAIIVSKNKKEGIIKAYNDGYDIVILDDGFQNSRIKKDLSLVVVDSQILFGNELIFP